MRSDPITLFSFSPTLLTEATLASLLLLKHANHVVSQGPCTLHFTYWEGYFLRNSNILPVPII